uniref:Archease domain-containing protein n=1 Tax=Steinernema glaseri TaxID=37863 RepID=A0A1I7YS32_9BILA
MPKDGSSGGPGGQDEKRLRVQITEKELVGFEDFWMGLMALVSALRERMWILRDAAVAGTLLEVLEEPPAAAE